jgi:hypothetical protein
MEWLGHSTSTKLTQKDYISTIIIITTIISVFRGERKVSSLQTPICHRRLGLHHQDEAPHAFLLMWYLRVNISYGLQLTSVAGQCIKLLDHFNQNWVTRTEGLTSIRLCALGQNCIRQENKGRYIWCNPSGMDIFELPYSYIYVNKRCGLARVPLFRLGYEIPLSFLLNPHLRDINKISWQRLRKRLPYAAA